MNAIFKRILVGAVGLTLVAAPLAASAQDHDGHDRGQSYHGDRDNRGNDHRDRDDRYRGDRDRYNVGYARPVYQQRYYNGYYGYAPGGFQGFYYNGGWYHHRRMSAGIYIYF